MRKSLLKLLGVVAALTLSTCVSAVGMGGINVVSALGQPLKASIELVAVNKADKASLIARLASSDAYKGAGLEYPFDNKFKFQIETRANGELYLNVSSAQPVNDPFVSMLVELTWASGRLLREYTFLLDPPGYVPEQAKPAEVQTFAPAVQSAPAVQPAPEEAEPVGQAAAVESQPIAQPAEQQPAQQEEQQPAEKTVEATAEKSLTPTPVKRADTGLAKKDFAVSNITVQSGDTLNAIAMQNKPSDVSLERMLVALYRANADQFDSKNMNRIKAGKILRMPDQNELMGVAQSEAAKEIRAQTADWNAYRQKLAGAATTAKQPQESQQVATGKIASSVADKAPIAKESAKEVLKLSKGEALGDKAATGAAGKTPSAQDKKNAAREDAIAKDKALKEEQTRAALLEKNLKDMQRLAQLKAEAAALLQSQSASAVTSVPLSAVSSVVAASEVQPAAVAQPEPKVVVPPPPPPSLLDQIMGNPIYLAGGAIALLGLAGAGVALSRRRKKTFAAETKDAGAQTGHISVPVAPSPETGDFTSAAAATSVAASTQQDDVDPLTEADLFLNFGRDVQAEEVLKDALRNMPGDHRIHLKLLGIYANRKDTKSFAAIARQLQDSGDEEAWQQAAAMGRKLEPNNPMYGGGTIEDADSATMQTAALDATPDFVLDDTPVEPEVPAADVDFDLGDADKTAILTPEDIAAVQSESMDFDVTSTNPSLVAPMATDFDVESSESAASAPTEMDFDISAIDAAIPAAEVQAEAPSADMDDLVFDVTSTQPAIAEEEVKPAEPAAEEPSDEDGMAFTLDFPVEEAKPAPAAQPAEVGLGGINLNFDDAATPSAAAPEVKDEHWHEVATKLDLAKAYHEMGDAIGAREILEEVLREGDEGQREVAQSLLDQIG
ncbi:MAG: hypothetical protein PHP70_07510 [Gallionella sp.]|nr:hypothetical protein [Gallionella sp.]